MENKLTDNDIHDVLDSFGSSPDDIKRFSNTTGGVDFTDPLLVTFKSESQRKSSEKRKHNKKKKEKDIGTWENVDPVWFDNSLTTFLQNDWQELFDVQDYFSRIRDMALHGRLRQTSFRGVCWKIFWECLPEEREHWISATNTLRKDFESIRDKHILDPYELSPETDLHVNNPLSQEAESPWHQYFKDSELNQTIVQDLERLYPEFDFFHQEKIQEILLRCLFCYGKEHPEVDYKQGMHEILAPVVYVLWENAQTVKESKEDLQDAIRIINDLAYVEHDAYCLFTQIMETMEPLFLNNRKPMCNDSEEKLIQSVVDTDNLFVASGTVQPLSAISKKLTRIQNYMLKRYDHDLFLRLQQLDIAPQLYGIRWIRLLFGREFPLTTLLSLWDAMFADGMSLDFADYIFIAMLISIRSYLLKNDYTSCLSFLMKYPPTIEAKTILNKALALKRSKPHSNQAKRNMKGMQHKSSNQKYLIRQPSESLTQEQKFAQALGSSKLSKAHQQMNKQSQQQQQSATWYANSEGFKDDEISSSTVGIQESSRYQPEASRTQISDARKLGRPSRPQSNKPNVVSQISSVLGKHTAGLSNEVLSKLSARTRNRPKDSNVSQLEEDHERLQKQVCELQSDLDRLQSLCLFCAGKMNSYVGFIDARECTGTTKEHAVTVSCITGLKEVRDILKSSIDLEKSNESYERRFSSIDKSLSVAFEGDEKNEKPISGPFDVPLSISNTGSFEEATADEEIIDPEPADSEMPRYEDAASNNAVSKEQFDYPGYGSKNNNADNDNSREQSLTSSNSERSLSELRSDASTPSLSSSQDQPTLGIQPIDSPSDFEKELLSIKNKYGSDKSRSIPIYDKESTVLEDMPMHGSSFTSSSTRAGDHDPSSSSQFLDPLSALEQHFS
eukprot:gene3474-3972_t